MSSQDKHLASPIVSVSLVNPLPESNYEIIEDASVNATVKFYYNGFTSDKTQSMKV